MRGCNSISNDKYGVNLLFGFLQHECGFLILLEFSMSQSSAVHTLDSVCVKLQALLSMLQSLVPLLQAEVGCS